MASKRWHHAAVGLEGNMVLVIGGDDGRNTFASTEILDLGTGQTTPGPTMASKRCGPAAMGLGGSRVLGA